MTKQVAARIRRAVEFLVVTVALVLPGVVFATDTTLLGVQPPPTLEGIQTTFLPNAIVNIVNFLLILASLVALIFIIIGGVQYIFSFGDDRDRAVQARNTILYAIIGLIIIGLAWAIASFVATAVGIGGVSS